MENLFKWFRSDMNGKTDEYKQEFRFMSEREKQQFEARRLVEERWNKLGFTEGLHGYLKDSLAEMFECKNQHIDFEEK